MTKDFFEYVRFRAYLRKLWTEQKHFALTFSVILAGLIFIIEVFCVMVGYRGLADNMGYTPQEDPAGMAIYIGCLLLLLGGGCISATRLLTDGQQKAGRIHVLTMPVSVFESWLARVLIFVVGYFVMFHAIFYAFELVRWALFAPIYPAIPIAVQHLFDWSVTSSAWFPGYVYATVFYGCLISFYTLGCFVFPKRPLLSTTVCLFCLGMVMMFLSIFSMSFSSLFREVMAIWVAVLTVSFFWLSYKRFRELEIIDRM